MTSKATPRLTLSYGVRYSFYSAATMEGNNITNFNAATFSPAQAPAVTTAGGFVVNSSNQPLTPTGNTPANYPHQWNRKRLPESGTPCGFTTPKKNLFAPRLGFAYRLNDKGHHGPSRRLRGVGYAQVGMFQTSALLSNSPYVSTPSFQNTQFSTPRRRKRRRTSWSCNVKPSLVWTAPYRPAMVQSWSLELR